MLLPLGGSRRAFEFHLETRAHLGRGFACERHRGHRLHAAAARADQRGHASDQARGFSRAGRGLNKNRGVEFVENEVALVLIRRRGCGWVVHDNDLGLSKPVSVPRFSSIYSSVALKLVLLAIKEFF